MPTPILPSPRYVVNVTDMVNKKHEKMQKWFELAQKNYLKHDVKIIVQEASRNIFGTYKKKN